LGEKSLSLELESLYVDAGIEENDNKDGNITSAVVTSSNVDTSKAGTYTVTYDVVDASGNKSLQFTRTITVLALPQVLTANFTLESNPCEGHEKNREEILIVMVY